MNGHKRRHRCLANAMRLSLLTAGICTVLLSNYVFAGAYTTQPRSAQRTAPATVNRANAQPNRTTQAPINRQSVSAPLRNGQPLGRPAPATSINSNRKPLQNGVPAPTQHDPNLYAQQQDNNFQYSMQQLYGQQTIQVMNTGTKNQIKLDNNTTNNQIKLNNNTTTNQMKLNGQLYQHEQQQLAAQHAHEQKLATVNANAAITSSIIGAIGNVAGGGGGGYQQGGYQYQGGGGQQYYDDGSGQYADDGSSQ